MRRLLLLTILLLVVTGNPVRAETVVGSARVVDGDTLDIGGNRVRLYGIDAPEAGQVHGQAAVTALASLASGKEVHCRGTERDAYDRLLATCRVGDLELNAEMVSSGHAWAFARYSSVYVGLEQQARSAQRGLWNGAPEAPWTFREKRWAVEQQASQNGCPIKGNITRNGERIYHVPWSPWYAKTTVDERQGERWFCSEEEAFRAGWRAPYWR